ncbi:hypothetical protein KIN20_023867 [Parelaphostrongylus tenuis]|uniref:Uncharacterized protein n=1 Tax=Parelaphostrongylus tenuis TaxID=148309 RepID=A0AAD5NAG4_PARTN|nr:hypothetical protein KIN20_023867 [Parelaphostrongylus tenuis]
MMENIRPNYCKQHAFPWNFHEMFGEQLTENMWNTQKSDIQWPKLQHQEMFVV